MPTLDKTETETTSPEETPSSTANGKPAAPFALTISLSKSTLVSAILTALPTLLAAALGVLLWLARGDLAERDAAAADDRHAEQVATDYAVGAATINYKDFDSWVAELKSNTVPALANTFDATAPKLQELMIPLQWTSTAAPIAAKVESESDGVYKVDVFVNVNSANAQNPQGAQTTVTYSITVDSNADWKISDVGGTAAALPLK